MLQILFGVISVLGILAALGTVLARNLVHAALFLVAFFFIVACQFILLEAEFLAAVQVLVYIGAVAILLMFGIMLTRNIQGDDTTTISLPVRQLSIVIAIGVITILIYGISTQEQSATGRKPWKDVASRPSIGRDVELTKTPRAIAVNQMARVVGDDLLSRYVIAFEVAGILLTAAVVGAIALAHQDREDDPAVRGRADLAASEALADDYSNAPVVVAASIPSTLTPSDPR